ncbi:MAG: alkaline phosphatase [Candidatus Geothermarchaeales archaeon]
MVERTECLKSILASFLVISSLLLHFTVLEASEEATGGSVILMIGDGMGSGQLSAAKISLGLEGVIFYPFPLPGEEISVTGSRLKIEGLTHGGTMTTNSIRDVSTDSAASATAMATGFKAHNNRISILPNGTELPTVLEFAESLGMSTGLVTTTRVTHATPAAFASHVTSRNRENEIAFQLIHSGVDVLLGGGRGHLLPQSDPDSDRFDDRDLIQEAVSLGFTYTDTRAQMLELAPDAEKLLGLFTLDHMNYEWERNPEAEPSLEEMTEIAIRILSRNPKGFFLMVEGGRIDHAGHENNMGNVIEDTLAFDEAVGVALDFVRLQGNTTLIVTADHETGGLSILEGAIDGPPRVEWSWNGHTANLVPVFSEGPFASLFSGLIDNTDIGKNIFRVLVSPPGGVDLEAQEQMRRLLVQIDELERQLSSTSSRLDERDSDLESAEGDRITLEAELASVGEELQTTQTLAYVAATLATALALLLLVTRLRRRA